MFFFFIFLLLYLRKLFIIFFRVCVGIQVAPADNEDWYCRLCIAKKQEQYHDKKKKKRKKKVKVNA
jgi:hypothetical protein